MLTRSLASLAALVAVSALAGCSSDGAETATDPGSSTSTSVSSSESPSPSPAESPSESAATSPAEGAAACTYTEEGGAAKPAELPPTTPAYDGEVAATVSTSAGEIPVTLDATNAPCTVNSFLSLAEQGYFDDTPCHRLTTEGIFVLQGGDPTGTGTGGPGYSFGDELSGTETYPAGTLAMANAGPNTNGSQFFMVYDDTELSPDYTVFGTIDPAGLTVVQGVAAGGVKSSGRPGDGAPKTPVDITAVTID